MELRIFRMIEPTISLVIALFFFINDIFKRFEIFLKDFLLEGLNFCYNKTFDWKCTCHAFLILYVRNLIELFFFSLSFLLSLAELPYR